MSKPLNWSSFYELMCQLGPDLLLGIDDETRDMVRMAASSTDMFWSEGLQLVLEEGAVNGSMRTGVLSALELWRENVLSTLDADFGIDLNWQSVSIDTASPLINEIVEAASAK